MTTQAVATFITFAGIAVIAGVFLFVLSRSGERADYAEVQPRAYGLRRWLLVVMLVGLFVVPALTLRSLPYSAAAAIAAPTVVEVTAHQWYWALDKTEVPAGRPIVFRLKSEDVNHGFGIYDEGNRLIAQVQAKTGASR